MYSTVFLGKNWLPRFVSTIILIRGSPNLKVLVLGIINDYLRRIYRRINPRPVTVIEREVNAPNGDIARATWVPPGHFYSPLVDPNNRHVRRIIDGHAESELPETEALSIDDQTILDTFYQISVFFTEIPFKADKVSGLRYYFANPAFSFGDGATYFGMLRYHRPQRVIEVGSGFSSCLVMDTNDLFFEGSIDFRMIEPYPDVLRSLIPKSDPYWAKLQVADLQDVPTSFFTELMANDILFIDSSHVCKTGSDVSDYFFRILPALRPGVLVHIHDIFYPFEYATQWIDVENRSWNEAHVLHSFLQYNHAFKIIYFCHYMHRRHQDLLREKLPMALTNSGGSIWLQKVGV